MTTPLPSGVREVAIGIARQACEKIVHYFDAELTVEKKSDGSPVTQADIEINALALSQIEKAFPSHGFIGEELGDKAPDKDGYVWLCDPIDGTRPFVWGFPVSTFSLALVRDGEPVFGLVAYPTRNWTIVAQKDHGATLNDKPIRVSDAPSIRGQGVDVLAPSRLAFHVPGLYDAVDQAGGMPICYNSTAISASFVARGALVAASGQEQRHGMLRQPRS